MTGAVELLRAEQAAERAADELRADLRAKLAEFVAEQTAHFEAGLPRAGVDAILVGRLAGWLLMPGRESAALLAVLSGRTPTEWRASLARAGIASDD